MKTRILLPVSLAFIGIVIMSSTSNNTTNNGDCTGSPLANGTTCYTCHNTGATRPITIMFATELGGGPMVTSFTPGKEYTITITSAQPTALFPTFGFQACALTSDGQNAGAFTAATAGAVLASKDGVSYVEHGAPIYTTGGTSRIQMNWTAPSTDKSVTFYAAMLHSNGYGNKEGDIPSHPDKLVLSSTLSVKDANDLAAAVKLYPNPAADHITIELPQRANSADVHVYDLSGKMVYSAQAKGTLVINTSGFAKGVYTLQMTSGEYYAKKLFVVQ